MIKPKLTYFLLIKKKESISIDMSLDIIIHNIEITLGNDGQLIRTTRYVAKLIKKRENQPH